MLEIKNLVSGYGEATVLKELNCTIAPGGVSAIMGRNGMGKTTLLKTIMGLVRAQSGEIFFNAVPIHSLPTHQIAHKKLGYVPQGREVFDKLTVLENLRLSALGSSKENLQLLPQIYEWFPVLQERSSQKAGTLSGGQQQMLAIARTLIGRPEIILLDEPSEGIQPSIVHEIATRLKKIALSTGLTILLVEQNVDMVMTMADHIHFMENGEIRETVGKEELRNSDEKLRTYLSV
ncbi:ABC transporter ATP-binding protein [Sneathiella glossodoripedis]|uniref:ABC transporter ATP-binding protein n=1 Tax=Sneathiella glossodoripedis TaxID=418853 RepID=UPI0004715A3C|nr:ABC transporter ATP-binding protein [Sneathiella glossodoripedis]